MSQPTDQPKSSTTGSPVLRTLLITDFVSSTELIETLGDRRAAEIFAQHDRAARDILAAHDGIEIDKTDGFLFLFKRPIDAVLFSLSYHDMLRELSRETQIALQARAGIHVGEVVLRQNTPDDVARGAKPVEVDGLSKHAAARVMSVALGGQTLMTGTTYQFAKRGSVGESRLPEDVEWAGHGDFKLKGIEDPVPLYEIGRKGFSPLRPPPDGEKVRRIQNSKGDTSRGARARLLYGALAGVTLAALLIISLRALFPEPEPSSAPSEASHSQDRALQDGEASTATGSVEADIGDGRAQHDAIGETSAEVDKEAEFRTEPEAEVVLEIVSVPSGATIKAGGSEGISRHKIRVPALPDTIEVSVSMAGYKSLTTSCPINKGHIEQGISTCELTLTRKPRRAPPVSEETETTGNEKADTEVEDLNGYKGNNPY
jgi:class 3 adenylate cyclase